MATFAAMALMAYATYRSGKQQREAAEGAAAEQRKQNEIQNRTQQVSRVRDIRRAVAQQRVQQAQLVQQGVSSGVAGSSIVQGAVGAVGTDQATAIGAANSQLGAAQGILASRNRQSELQVEATQPNKWTYIAQGASIFTNQQNVDATTGLFGG